MFRNSENCDPNRVKGSLPGSKPHFERLAYRLTTDKSTNSLTVPANRESNYSRKWVLTNDSLTTSVFCAGLKFWQKEKHWKSSDFSALRRFAILFCDPRRGFEYFANSLEFNMFILVRMQNVPSWDTSLLLRFSIIYCLAAARTLLQRYTIFSI